MFAVALTLFAFAHSIRLLCLLRATALRVSLASASALLSDLMSASISFDAIAVSSASVLSRSITTLCVFSVSHLHVGGEKFCVKLCEVLCCKKFFYEICLFLCHLNRPSHLIFILYNYPLYCQRITIGL